MADQEQRRREEEFLREEDSFRRNAFLLTNTVVELMSQAPGDIRALVKEFLQSIFFLGRIHKPPFSPESILGHQVLSHLKFFFREPIDFWRFLLPMRSPFSCVLDMIVRLTGQEKETEIINRLRELIRNLKLGESRDLVSSTICVSHRTDVEVPVKYYGVSMSAPGRIPRQIMIAASCLSSWDSYVAGAVMTYFPTKNKKIDFDGTIQLPTGVRCQAFNLLDGSEKPPCRSCGNLFGLATRENDEWVYGNCAEVESLSNLFKNVGDVKERARPTSMMYSDNKRYRVERCMRADLTNTLQQREFRWFHEFYES